MTETIPKCPGCGAVGTVHKVARARREVHRGVAVDLPATLALTECSACSDCWLDDNEADAFSSAVDAAYADELRRRALESLAHLDAAVTQQKLEQLLHLSPGYISKLRHGVHVPSATLVGHLALLAVSPKKRVAELERFWSTA